MENLSRNLERNVISYHFPISTKKSRHWDLLIVDNRGKMVKIPWIREIAVLLILLLISAIGTSSVLSVLYSDKKKEHNRLQTSMNVLSSERNILIARLGAVESKIGNKTAEKPPLKIVEKSLKSVSNADDIQEQQLKKVSKNVAIENISVSYHETSNTLKILFTIKNISPERNIAGYAFIILKKSEDNPKEWLTVPSADIVSGKPSEIAKGQYFNITNFKSVKFTIKSQDDPARFEIATIVVYSSERELIWEETVPISVKMVEVPKWKEKGDQQRKSSQRVETEQKNVTFPEVPLVGDIYLKDKTSIEESQATTKYF